MRTSLVDVPATPQISDTVFSVTATTVNADIPFYAAKAKFWLEFQMEEPYISTGMPDPTLTYNTAPEVMPATEAGDHAAIITGLEPDSPIWVVACWCDDAGEAPVGANLP